MISSKCILAAGIAICCCAVAHARQVDLVRFSQLAVATSVEQDTVRNALNAHLARLAKPNDTADNIQGAYSMNASNPSEVYKSAYHRISALSASDGCQQNGYRPAWWLSPEVEQRRQSFFTEMSAIACENGLPESLLDAVIAQESGYKAWALSRSGAMGMMQVMPGTAKKLELRNPWDALANMRAGARYLRQQLDRFGRVDLALAAYNAGPERRSLALGNVPAIAETVNYVRAITTNWVRLTQLEGPDPDVAARAIAASMAVRASGYREVSLITYQGTNVENPI
jgi:soluble lytic murein transglycosylase-like protein